MSEGIAFRERRYQQKMGIRVPCFAVIIVMSVAHAGWLTAIPGAGAILIPCLRWYLRMADANRTAHGGSASMRRACQIGSPTPPGSGLGRSRSATSESAATSFSDDGQMSHSGGA